MTVNVCCASLAVALMANTTSISCTGFADKEGKKVI